MMTNMTSARGLVKVDLIMVIKGWDGLNLSLMDEEHDRGTAVVPGLGHEPAL